MYKTARQVSYPRTALSPLLARWGKTREQLVDMPEESRKPGFEHLSGRATMGDKSAETTAIRR